MAVRRGIRTITLALALFLTANAYAKHVGVAAETDRSQMADDESVSLQVTVSSDESVNVETPEYEAPDFETIHEYQSSSMQSSYSDGQFRTETQRVYTFVLRPRKQGTLKITGIRVKVDGADVTAPNREVVVGSGGAATAPPANYGGAGSGLRGAGKAPRGAAVFLRAEVDKQKIYKGDSVVVSYYFFARANGFTVAGEKYPVMAGFLKEEVDMPVLTGRLDSQVVTLDGVPYRKVLLARYNATPLKAGSLIIDPLWVKAQYYGESNARRQGGNGDGDDEYQDLFSQFFNRLTPQVAQVKSDPVTLTVEETPKGPEDSNGAIGEFTAVLVVDKNEVPVNQPVTVSLKIEGRGNLTSMRAPVLTLPTGLQLFESKDEIHGGKAGTSGERIFQYLVVPRTPGAFSVPGVHFSYFSTKSGKFETITTDGFALNATGTADPADSGPLPTGNVTDTPAPARTAAAVPAVPLGVQSALRARGGALSRGALTALLALALALTVPLGILFWRRRRKLLDPERERRDAWNREAADFERTWANVNWESMTAAQAKDAATAAYNHFLSWCAIRYGERARGLPREELRDFLVTPGNMTEDRWNQFADVLSSLEMIQFSGTRSDATGAGMKTETKRAIDRLRALLDPTG